MHKITTRIGAISAALIAPGLDASPPGAGEASTTTGQRKGDVMRVRMMAWRGLAALAMIPAAVAVQSGSSEAATQPDRSIQNAGNYMCMDLRSYGEHTPVTMYRCTDHVSAKWIWRSDGTIQNVGGELCMDLRSYNQHTPVTMYRCTDHDSAKWVWNSDNGTIRNVGSSQCMDLESYDEHTPVTMYRCTDHISAKWSR